MVDKRQSKFDILKIAFQTVGIVVFLVGSIHLLLDVAFGFNVGMKLFIAITFTLLGIALFALAIHQRIVSLSFAALSFCYVLYDCIITHGRLYDFFLQLQRLDTHLGLMAVSFALCIFCVEKRSELMLWISGLITAWVAGVSVLILFGDLVEVTYIFWPYELSLSILGACIFFLIDAMILIRIALAFHHRYIKRFALWSGLLAGVLVFAAVLFSWIIFQAQDEKKMIADAREKMSLINEGILDEAAHLFVILDEGELSSLVVGSALVNRDGSVMQSSGVLGELPKNIKQEQWREITFIDNGMMRIISPDSNHNYLIAFVKAEPFLAKAISDVVEDRYIIDVMVNGKSYFTSEQQVDRAFELKGNLPLYGSLLVITIAPQTEYLLILKSPLALFNLILGMILAFVIGFMIYFAQKAKQRQKEAEQASKEKTFFLKNVSHELRSPLHGILGSYSLLEQTELTESQQRWLDGIGESGHNLLELVNQLLNLSMAEVGGVVISKKPVDLEALLESLLAEHNEVAQHKKLKLQLLYSPNLPKVFMLDDERIKELLGHLIENGLKFTTFGSVRINVEGGKIKTGNYLLTIKVEDTGDGISEGDLSTIFFTYHSLDVRGETASSGMGLAYTKRLAELMDGDLTVTSILKEGSVFTLEVPVESVL